jgi:uncharacterized glyoxalase superfamily protein PhnB
MNHVSLVSVFVENQDHAIEFYRDKLGFVVAEDVPFGSKRWVTVRAPGDQTVALTLKLAETDVDRKLIGRQGGTQPLLGLGTDDCMADYQRMKSAGVKFHGEPQVQPYGTGVTLEDLYGNQIYLNQEAV